MAREPVYKSISLALLLLSLPFLILLTGQGTCSTKQGIIHGQILDARGRPIRGALIFIDGTEPATSGAAGLFTMRGIEPGVHRVEVSRSGFFNSAQIVTVSERYPVTFRERLLRKGARHAFDADQQVLLHQDNLRVQIPAGALVDKETRAAVSGEVIAHIKPINVFTEDRAGAPGPLLGKPAGQDQLVSLFSLGMFTIEIEKNGRELDIRQGERVAIEMDVFDADVELLESVYDLTGGDIPMWSLDEEALVWIEEPEATGQLLRPSNVEGRWTLASEIVHFSSWNYDLDADSDYTCATTQVLDENGSPVAGALVDFHSEYHFGAATTGEDGSACIQVNNTTNSIWSYYTEQQMYTHIVATYSYGSSGLLKSEPLIFDPYYGTSDTSDDLTAASRCGLDTYHNGALDHDYSDEQQCELVSGTDKVELDDLILQSNQCVTGFVDLSGPGVAEICSSMGCSEVDENGAFSLNIALTAESLALEVWQQYENSDPTQGEEGWHRVANHLLDEDELTAHIDGCGGPAACSDNGCAPFDAGQFGVCLPDTFEPDNHYNIFELTALNQIGPSESWTTIPLRSMCASSEDPGDEDYVVDTALSETIFKEGDRLRFEVITVDRDGNSKTVRDKLTLELRDTDERVVTGHQCADADAESRVCPSETGVLLDYHVLPVSGGLKEGSGVPGHYIARMFSVSGAMDNSYQARINVDNCWDHFEYDFYPQHQDVDKDGKSAAEGDCNDSNPVVRPERSEECDGLDNDCDGNSDEGFDATCLDGSDVDGDGYRRVESDEGDENDENDCDDTAANVYPGAVETCDGIDNDCNGTADEAACGESRNNTPEHATNVLLMGSNWKGEGGTSDYYIFDTIRGGSLNPTYQWLCVNTDDADSEDSADWYWLPIMQADSYGYSGKLTVQFEPIDVDGVKARVTICQANLSSDGTLSCPVLETSSASADVPGPSNPGSGPLELETTLSMNLNLNYLFQVAFDSIGENTDEIRAPYRIRFEDSEPEYYGCIEADDENREPSAQVDDAHEDDDDWTALNACHELLPYGICNYAVYEDSESDINGCDDLTNLYACPNPSDGVDHFSFPEVYVGDTLYVRVYWFDSGLLITPKLFGVNSDGEETERSYLIEGTWIQQDAAGFYFIEMRYTAFAEFDDVILELGFNGRNSKYWVETSRTSDVCGDPCNPVAPPAAGCP